MSAKWLMSMAKLVEAELPETANARLHDCSISRCMLHTVSGRRRSNGRPLLVGVKTLLRPVVLRDAAGDLYAVAWAWTGHDLGQKSSPAISASRKANKACRSVNLQHTTMLDNVQNRPGQTPPHVSRPPFRSSISCRLSCPGSCAVGCISTACEGCCSVTGMAVVWLLQLEGL
jgi:hypothetical protein